MRPHFNSYGTKRAEMPINNSARPYQRNRDRATAPPRRTRSPAPHEPKPRPAMNMDTTIETKAVVTPKLAIESRSQTSSYTRLQQPETTKNTKDHGMFGETSCARCVAVVGGEPSTT